MFACLRYKIARLRSLAGTARREDDAACEDLAPGPAGKSTPQDAAEDIKPPLRSPELSTKSEVSASIAPAKSASETSVAPSSKPGFAQPRVVTKISPLKRRLGQARGRATAIKKR